MIPRSDWSTAALFAGLPFPGMRADPKADAHRKVADGVAGALARSPPLQPADQQFSFVNHFFRQAFVQIEKEFFVLDHF